MLCSGIAGRSNTQAVRHSRRVDRPPAFVAMLLGVSALVYVPMELTFGADALGYARRLFIPSEPSLLYATYFLVGVKIGSSGIEVGRRSSRIRASAAMADLAVGRACRLCAAAHCHHRARRCRSSAAHSTAAYSLCALLSDLTVVLCCGTISFAFIALFRRFAVCAPTCLRQPQCQFLRDVSYSLPHRRLDPIRAARGRTGPSDQGRHRLCRRGRSELGNNRGAPSRSDDRAPARASIH